VGHVSKHYPSEVLNLVPVVGQVKQSWFPSPSQVAHDV